MDANIIDNTEIDLDIEDAIEETDAELLDDGDDEITPGYEDHLSEVLRQRIRNAVPRSALFAGEATDGYVEVFTERPELVNDSIVDQVGLCLVGEDLLPKAKVVQGVLRSDFVNGDQLLELRYQHHETGEQPGFVYSITLDGRWVKGFRSSALAQLAYEIVVDHPVSRFADVLARVIYLFHTRGVARGEDRAETVSEDFLFEVAHAIDD